MEVTTPPATYSCSANGLINNAGIRTIDLSQLGVPAGNTATSGNSNGITANTVANIYYGNYFPANASNWNTVALSGNFTTNGNTTTPLTNAIFDTAAFNLLNPNWSTIEFGHQNYSATTNGQAVNNKIDLANIMNNFGGLFYTQATAGTNGQPSSITLVADGSNWANGTAVANATTVEGFGTIEADLDATTVVKNWNSVGSTGEKTKTHNGVTWTYTPGDNATGKLASLEATVLSMKVKNNNDNIIKYFSGNPAWTSAEQMVKNMKKKTIRIFFKDNNNDSNGGITIN